MKALANIIFIASFVFAAVWWGGFMDQNPNDIRDSTFKGQVMHREHEMTMEQLIDYAEKKAEDHKVYNSGLKVYKTSLAMLELYGTDKESNWAFNVAKGE